MPPAVEIFLNVDEVDKELTLVLQMLINDLFAVKDSFNCAQSRSESRLPLDHFQCVKYYQKHDYAEKAGNSDTVVGSPFSVG